MAAYLSLQEGTDGGGREGGRGDGSRACERNNQNKAQFVLVRLVPAAQAKKMQLSLKLPDPGRGLYREGAQI